MRDRPITSIPEYLRHRMAETLGESDRYGLQAAIDALAIGASG